MLEIPVFDLSLVGARPDESARLLAAARLLGCFRVSGHGVPLELQASMKAAARALHELPVDAKRRSADVAPPDSGYVHPSAANPLFESLAVHDASAPADVEAFCDLIGAPPHIRATIGAYAEKTHELALDVAAKMAAGLGVGEEEEGGSSSAFCDWPCQLRMNRYNYTAETVGSPGVQVHTDSSFLTVLLEDDRIGGLEVADPDTAEFEPVDLPLPGSLLVNIGDIATAWSNGELHNARHGVRCVAAAPRFTVGMFLLGPRDGGEVRAPEALVDARRPRRFRAFSYGEYRRARHSTLGRAGEALTQFAI